ncbi:MAG: hypothetical protein ABI895_05905 [Deltaproteobacteria bacterium]
MAEQGADQVRLDLVLAPPRAEGPPEVVRGATGDARAGARGGDVAADVAPGQKEEAAFSLAVVERVLEQRNREPDDGNEALRCFCLGASK